MDADRKEDMNLFDVRLAGWRFRGLLSALTITCVARAHHPHDVISAVAVSPDFAHDATIVCASPGSINVLLISRDGGLTWDPLHRGLRGTEYHVLEFAPDWRTSGVLYVGTEEGGLQVSSDRGRSWSAPPPNLTSHVHFITSAPASGSGAPTVFCDRYGCYLYRSDDHGVTFHQLWRLPTNFANITAIAVSPTFAVDGIVIVSTDDGRVHFSDTGGDFWASTLAPAVVTDIALSGDFGSDGMAWMSTWGQGVQQVQFVSGTPAFAPAANFGDLFVNDLELVAAPLSRDTQVLLCASKDAGLFASADGGYSWTRLPLSIQLSSQSTNHYTKVVASPTWSSDGRMFCGTYEGLMLGFEHGQKWIETLINPTRSGRQVTVSPAYANDQTLFAGGYGQSLLRSRDRGQTWQTCGHGFECGSVYELAVSPDFANDHIVLCSAIFGLRRSADGGDTWTRIDLQPQPNQPPAPGGGWAIFDIAFSPDFANDHRVYALSEMGAVYESLDAGVTWAFATVNPIQNPFTYTMALSPTFAQDQTMFVAGRGIYASSDAGRHFQWTYPHRIIEEGLAVPPDWPTTGEFYALTAHFGFVILNNNGATSIQSNTGLDGYAPTAIALSPDFVNDSKIFVMTSGGGLYVSADRGRTWSPAGLPRELIANAKCLAVSPAFVTDHTLFAGVYAGHIASTDGGATWRLATDYESYDDSRDPWDRDGNWAAVSAAGSNIYGVRQSSTAGDSMVLPFDGTGVILNVAVGPDRGMAQIWLDGIPYGLVDTYAPVAAGSSPVFTRTGLPSGLHVLSVQVSGSRNSQSQGNSIAIDEARVYYR